MKDVIIIVTAFLFLWLMHIRILTEELLLLLVFILHNTMSGVKGLRNTNPICKKIVKIDFHYMQENCKF